MIRENDKYNKDVNITDKKNINVLIENDNNNIDYNNHTRTPKYTYSSNLTNNIMHPFPLPLPPSPRHRITTSPSYHMNTA